LRICVYVSLRHKNTDKFQISFLLRHDGGGSNTAETASHSDVLWIRRDTQLSSVLTAAVIRERAEKLTGSSDKYT